jgi:hypothetical protein
VNATQAPIGLLHAHFVFPILTGPVVISYPKWIPGEHAPTGPINQVVRMVFSVGGKQLAQRRDELEQFNFHMEIPVGASQLEADLDFACEVGAAASLTSRRIHSDTREGPLLRDSEHRTRLSSLMLRP